MALFIYCCAVHAVYEQNFESPSNACYKPTKISLHFIAKHIILYGSNRLIYKQGSVNPTRLALNENCISENPSKN